MLCALVTADLSFSIEDSMLVFLMRDKGVLSSSSGDLGPGDSDGVSWFELTCSSLLLLRFLSLVADFGGVKPHLKDANKRSTSLMLLLLLLLLVVDDDIFVLFRFL